MELIVRATVIYFFLWIVTRGTGKRELSQISAFELILLVTMGDLVQQGVTQEDMSLTGAFLTIGTIAFWVLVFATISWRFPRTRTAIEGVPVIVFRQGEFIEAAMRRERVTRREVLQEARAQGIADLGDVVLGVLEPDGRFSFLQDKNSTDQQGDEPKSLS